MQRQPLRLPVLLVPPQIQPVQPVKDGIERRLRVALDIRVVNAQDHRAAVTARVQPVEDEGARAPNVQKTSGRRRKAHSKHWKCQYNKAVYNNAEANVSGAAQMGLLSRARRKR